MLTLLATVLVIYLAIMALMWAKQRSLMYYPDAHMLPPASYGLHEYSAATLTTRDGLTLTFWQHLPQQGNAPVILYFHGNGGHLGYRAELLRAWADAGYGVLALSYRGYGGNPGAPTLHGLYADAHALLAYAQETLQLPPQQLIYYGESLGSGVASELAALVAPRMLVLASPYTSIADRAGELYPWLPVRLLLKDNFAPMAYIHRVHAPVLIIHGDRDTIVPLAHGKRLFDAANEPKRLAALPGIGHNDMPVETIVREMMEFGESLKTASAP